MFERKLYLGLLIIWAIGSFWLITPIQYALLSIFLGAVIGIPGCLLITYMAIGFFDQLLYGTETEDENLESPNDFVSINIKIVETSPEIVGTFNGQNIYEWMIVDFGGTLIKVYYDSTISKGEHLVTDKSVLIVEPGILYEIPKDLS